MVAKNDDKSKKHDKTNPTCNNHTKTQKQIFYEDFLGIPYSTKLFKKIKKYAKKHFNRFSAIIIAISTIGLWIIRALGYTYQSAQLSVYNIDKSYIMLTDNFFLQIIQFISVLIVLFALNFVYFKIATKKEKNHKRKSKIIILYLIEMLNILFFAITQTNYGINQLILEFKSYTFITWITLFILLFGFVFVINLFGFQAAHLYSKKEITYNDTSTKREESNIFSYTTTILVFLSLLFVISYLYGRFEEQSRNSFKIIAEEVNSYVDDDVSFKTSNDNICTLYAVVYENENIYILCQLHKTTNGVSINKNCQKVVLKDNLVTYNITNIYDIQYQDNN